ncbi:ATP-dependent DNA helicase RecQ [Bifidobacterium rousetti]|uniref:RecQ family ATP-dependent DNA helicase n=1 Tax=Bifidobacterium rousetti TaxID=2045439 RepID=UPI0012395009|nr:RecQ family ATP-dependent DNA helicase [Bifidobacterium rousetti]KAA8815709.1 ATP-dependent DNA helicase RecQ [Bifidobacterium rousetti]
MTEVASMQWLTEEPNDEKTKAIHDVMKRRFGYDSFRPGQYRAVRATADHHDSMVLIATGGGKSLCYMLPAARKNTFTLVLTPLKALMEDQVHHLVDNGIPAEYINQTVDVYKQREIYKKALAGRLRILYVTPERLGNENFLRFIHGMRKIDLLVVDEAHCVLDWGDGGFRPDYLRIRGFIESLRKRPVVMALTATASPAQEDEMKELLGLDDPVVIRTSADRPNIALHRVKIPRKEERLSFLIDWIREHPGKGVIYRENKNDGKDIADYLADHGVNVALYNAKLDDAAKSRTLEAFRTGELSVVVATTAFGMGIDIPDIRWVVNVGPCKNLEQFWQQTGRAGRDGLPADSVVIWWDGEFGLLRSFVKNEMKEAKNGSEFEKAKRKGERLSMMSEYCESNDCLRARMLRLFGEHPAPHCDSCDVCRPDLNQGAIDDHANGNGRRKTKRSTPRRTRPDAFDNTEATRQAMHKALVYIGRYMDGGETPIGVTTYAAGLTKSGSEKTKKYKLDRIPGYGDFEGTTQAKVGDIIYALVGIKALRRVGGRYAVLYKGEKFDQCLNDGMPGPDDMPRFAIPRDGKTADDDHVKDADEPTDRLQNRNIRGEKQEDDARTAVTGGFPPEDYATVCEYIRQYRERNDGNSLRKEEFIKALAGREVELVLRNELERYEQFGAFPGEETYAGELIEALINMHAIEQGQLLRTLKPGPRFEEFLHPQHRQEEDE